MRRGQFLVAGRAFVSFKIIDKNEVTRGKKGEGHRDDGGVCGRGTEGFFFRVRDPACVWAESGEQVRNWNYRTTGWGLVSLTRHLKRTLTLHNHVLCKCPGNGRGGKLRAQHGGLSLDSQEEETFWEDEEGGGSSF